VIDSDDMAVFYDTTEFAHVCTWSRPGEDDVPFAGILSSQDDDRFQGHASARVHVLRFPAAAVQMLPDDTVTTQARAADGTLQAAQAWRVLRTPELVVDGAEADVYLEPLPEV